MAIRFVFSSSLFGYQPTLKYSYKLKGFDEKWSEWQNRTEKEYTNLPAGDYSFEVKVRNNLGSESPEAQYAFKILPPWYQSFWAKILYIAILSAILYIIYSLQRKKFMLQQIKHEKEQKRLLYIHELEMNKTENELIALRNEKLEIELNYKNSELASSAMSLVKKGEILAKIKADLNQVIKRIDNATTVNELKKIVKTLTLDEHVDEEWENFTKHFDKVHSDFIVHLKEQHPKLSPNDLKLCAYLRMNLSSKEIAQLLNISVRGVEVSRYRLRKKLQISSDTNLFDYLINIQSHS